MFFYIHNDNLYFLSFYTIACPWTSRSHVWYDYLPGSPPWSWGWNRCPLCKVSWFIYALWRLSWFEIYMMLYHVKSLTSSISEWRNYCICFAIFVTTGSLYEILYWVVGISSFPVIVSSGWISHEKSMDKIRSVTSLVTFFCFLVSVLSSRSFRLFVVTFLLMKFVELQFPCNLTFSCFTVIHNDFSISPWYNTSKRIFVPYVSSNTHLSSSQLQ